MAKINVLVTGIGAIIGYGVISSLRSTTQDFKIVGMDIYDDAVGQMWCDKFIQAIPANSPEYIDFLKNVIDDNEIDIVFFGTEQEIQKCYENKALLGAYYGKLVINNDEIIRLSEDKWDTACFLEENGFDSIPGSIDIDFETARNKFGLPLLLKPRSSYASKGILRAETKEEFDSWKKENGKQFMVQKCIGDVEHEYTSAVFGFGDGTCSSVITLRRKLSKAGATDKAYVEDIPEIEEEIRKMVSILKPVGPTNFQFRKDGDKYLLLEINPRISSSTSIRCAFGYNEAQMCIEFFLNGKRPEIGEIRQGRAFRYITEVVEYYDSDNI